MSTALALSSSGCWRLTVIEGAKIIAWHLRATENLVRERLKAWTERNRSFIAWVILRILRSRFRRAFLYVVILFPGIFRMGMLGNMCVWRLLQYPVALSIFHELEVHRKRKAFVLDIGVGDAPFCSYLASRTDAQVVGIDLAAGAIEKQKESSQMLETGPKCLQVDVEKMAFSDRSFDVIFCLSALEHVLDDITAIREIHRVLRERGHLILSVPFSFGDRTDVNYPHGGFFFRYYTEAQVRSKFNQFTLVERRFVGKRLVETFFHPDRVIKYGRMIPLDYILGNFLNAIEMVLWDETTAQGIGKNCARVEGIYLFRK